MARAGPCSADYSSDPEARGSTNIGAYILRIGFWGILYSIYSTSNKEPPEDSIGSCLGSYTRARQALQVPGDGEKFGKAPRAATGRSLKTCGCAKGGSQD